MTKQTIGILGSGSVGQTLAKGFIHHGHSVMLGTRDPKKLAEWVETTGENAQAGTFEDTAAFGDILVLAVKGRAAKAALGMAGEGNLSGKIIMDATNPIDDAPPENGVLKFFTTFEKSLMEDLQETFPEARFVKAFNSIGSAYMVNPDFESKPTMFICGNDEGAKTEVSVILDIFGFEVEDMGGAEAARAIEPLCILWCIPGFLQNQWSHAFKLMKR
jgi:predicted dinucleotide-binding enzyme